MSGDVYRNLREKVTASDGLGQGSGWAKYPTTLPPVLGSKSCQRKPYPFLTRHGL